MKNLASFLTIGFFFFFAVQANANNFPVENKSNITITNDGDITNSQKSLLKRFAFKSAEAIGKLAYPEAEVQNLTVTVLDNTAYIYMEFYDNDNGEFSSQFAFSVEDGFIKNIRCLRDGTNGNAFGTLDLIMTIYKLQLLENGMEEEAVMFELLALIVLEKTTAEMTGKDLIVCVLNNTWIENGYAERF